MNFRDRAEFLRGRNGERLVADILQERGTYVIPSYDYAGDDHDKAPRLQGFENGYVLPDLDVAQEGRRTWVEVKTKKEASFYRKKQRLEHGIETRLYVQYLEVQRITGTPVWLVIYEEGTGAVLTGRLDKLGGGPDSIRHDDMWQGRVVPMVYFARDELMELPGG